MTNDISIHAPREGGDSGRTHITVKIRIFQSTPPARGATSSAFWGWCSSDISIHAPREGGDYVSDTYNVATGISIHAPREGGDGINDMTKEICDISIHAPREGGDRLLSARA